LNGPLDELYRRPGFLIRRANQIAVSLFLEETGPLGITNSQYGILLVLKHHPGIDQISVAKVLGLDRSTTGRAQAHVLSAFTVQERAEFIRLLDKFVAKFNDTTRVPLETHRAAAKRKADRSRAEPIPVAARR